MCSGPADGLLGAPPRRLASEHNNEILSILAKQRLLMIIVIAILAVDVGSINMNIDTYNTCES